MLTLYQRNAEHVSRETTRTAGYAVRGAFRFRTAVWNTCRSIRGHEGYRGPADRPDARERRSGRSRYRRPSVLSSFVRLHWQIQEPPGPSTTPPHLPGRESSLVRPPTIRVGGAKNGGRHRPRVTRQPARWLAPEDGAGAVIHERVPSETDLWGRRLLAGSTPTPGMTALDENRRVSD